VITAITGASPGVAQLRGWVEGTRGLP
jgi:hypothetical protein